MEVICQWERSKCSQKLVIDRGVDIVYLCDKQGPKLQTKLNTEEDTPNFWQFFTSDSPSCRRIQSTFQHSKNNSKGNHRFILHFVNNASLITVKSIPHKNIQTRLLESSTKTWGGVSGGKSISVSIKMLSWQLWTNSMGNVITTNLGLLSIYDLSKWIIIIRSI